MAEPEPVVPSPGQESVWDYPRPPRIEASSAHVVIVLGGITIVDTERSVRVLETSSPPVHYLHPEDFAPAVLEPCDGATWCEWKGAASYFDLVAGGRRARSAAWSYLDPLPASRAVAGLVAVYAGLVDACELDGERVRSQPGSFYGGWITSKVTGPFKGDPGTLRW